MLSSAVPVFIVRSLWLEHGIKNLKFDLKGLYSKSRSDKQTNEQTKHKQIFDL